MNGSVDNSCSVIICRIDGKDSSGVGTYGISVSVVDSHVLLYNGVFFGCEPIGESFSVAEAFAIVNSERPEDRPEELAGFELSFDDYIRTSQMFLTDKGMSDTKTLERKIVYFCTSVIGIHAITFIDVQKMTKSEIIEIIPSLEHNENDEGEENTDEEENSPEGDGDAADDASPEVAIRCDPVLDPVNGASAGSLTAGTMIYCKMREDSAYFNLMAKVSPDFDGIVTGEVAGVRVNDLGTATVVVNLSEGVTGAFKVSSNIRLKMSEKPAAGSVISERFAVEIIFAVAGVIIFLCLMAVLLYYLA